MINFSLQIEVCQVLFNCGDRDMQISDLICFISSLSILGVLIFIFKLFFGKSEMNLKLNTLNVAQLKLPLNKMLTRLGRLGNEYHVTINSDGVW